MRWITAAWMSALVVILLQARTPVAWAQGDTESDSETTTETTTTESDTTETSTEVEGDTVGDQDEGDEDEEGVDDGDDEGDDDDDEVAGDDDDDTTTTTADDDDDTTTGDDDDDTMAATPTDGPKPTTVLGLSAGITVGGLLTGILVFPGSHIAGVGLAAASVALFPSIGNVMLKEFGTAALWTGVRVVGELLIFAGLELIESGAAEASDGTQALGIFALFVGSVGTIGGAGADMGAAWATAEQRTLKSQVRSGFAMTPMRDEYGNWGVRAGWYTRF